MAKHKMFILLFLAFCLSGLNSFSQPKPDYSSKPYTRWWWFADVIDTNDVKYQLDWLKANNFGGVEIAFVYPYKGDSLKSRDGWLSNVWSEKVAFAKRYADKLHLGCDYTFGTLWPFGDSKVPDSEGTIFFGDTASEKTMRLTWEHPTKGRVLNHLDRYAFMHYAERVGGALSGAMKGTTSGLFVDSWEVETKKLWTKGFDSRFISRMGYDIKPFMDSLYSPGFEKYFYDYTKVMSEYVLYEFYKPFTDYAHSSGGFSRGQCGGAPADLLTAFSFVDVPETEAILYEPNFARIPASAALLGDKKYVSSETFTCIYGWKRWPGPGPKQKQEQVADLKLVADALFANGVNHIFWHGMPYNKKGDSAIFYASVHVGPDAGFADELPAFNKYMEKVSDIMSRGKAAASVGVYIPTEDAWMAVEYPDSLKFPWVWGQYEMRYIRTNPELKKFQPVWINDFFLRKSDVVNGKLICGNVKLNVLYIESDYIDYYSLKTILALAEKGLPVCIKKPFSEPGNVKNKDFRFLAEKLIGMKNVKTDFNYLAIGNPEILVECPGDYFCRLDNDMAYVFFSGPKARNLSYPLKYGQSLSNQSVTENAKITFGGKTTEIKLIFEPYQSLLLKINKDGKSEFININFLPKTPKTE